MLCTGRVVLPRRLALLPRDGFTRPTDLTQRRRVGDSDEAVLGALMGRLADGDRGAFEPLFRALHPRAVRLARLSLNEADAFDAAQSALENVFARASEVTPGRRALPWFYAVAANEVYAIARGVKTASARADTTVTDALRAADDPEQRLARAELRAAVDALDPLSAAAIANLLGDTELPTISPAAQRKRLSRADARLRHPTNAAAYARRPYMR